jgi:hypothetical protein
VRIHRRLKDPSAQKMAQHATYRAACINADLSIAATATKQRAQGLHLAGRERIAERGTYCVYKLAHKVPPHPAHRSSKLVAITQDEVECCVGPSSGIRPSSNVQSLSPNSERICRSVKPSSALPSRGLNIPDTNSEPSFECCPGSTAIPHLELLKSLQARLAPRVCAL